MTCPPSCEVLISLIAENGSMSEKDKRMLINGACNNCLVPVSISPQMISDLDIDFLYPESQRQDLLKYRVAHHRAIIENEARNKAKK